MFYRLLCLLPYLCLALIIPKESYKIPGYIYPDAPKQGTIHLAHVGNPKDLSPYSQSPDSYPGLSLVYETLIEKTDKEDTYVTLLAKDISYHTGYILITLEPQAPINASDVIRSIHQCQKKSPSLRYLCKKVKANQINERQLSIHYTISESELCLLLSTLPIVSKAGLGSGPYRLEHTKSSFKYHRNPQYWAKDLSIRQGRYNFDTVEYKFYSSQHAVSKAFEHHEIDYYLEYSAHHWHHKKDKDLVYETLAHPKHQYHQMLWYNYHKFPLEDPALRKALHILVDPAYINQWLYYGQYTTSSESSENYQISIRKRMIEASGYLKDSGWLMGSDGFRYKYGKRLELNLITYHRQLDPVLQLLKSHYRRIGIQLNIQQLSKAQYTFQRQHHDYHLIIRPLLMDTEHKSLSDIQFLEYYDIQPKLKVLNQIYPHMPYYLAYPLYQSMLETLKSEYVLTPLWSLDSFRVGYHQDLRFIHQNQSFVDIHTWWYEK